MTSAVAGELARLIIPFLNWKDRYRLAQTNRKLRETILKGKYEAEAFVYIAKVYNCFLEVFDKGGYGGNIYTDNKEYLSPRATSWLSALVRVDRAYERHYAKRAPLELPVGDEVWKIIEDPILSERVKTVKFISPDYIQGCQDCQDDQYLVDVCRLSFPEKRDFDLRNFMKLGDDDDYSNLAFSAHNYLSHWSDCLNYIAHPLISNAVRLVYVKRWGYLTALDNRPHRPSISRTRRYAKQPFINRAVMKDAALMEKYVTHADKNACPLIFTRWLTGHSIDEKSEPLLAERGAAVNLYYKNRDLFKVDPATFWTGEVGDENAPPLSNLAKDANSDCDADSSSDYDDPLTCAYVRYWRHALSEIERRLEEVFKPLSLDDATAIKEVYGKEGLILHEMGNPDESIGAYLELSLSDSEYGPNRRTAKNDHTGEIYMLYVGKTEAVLFGYHQHHC